MVTQSLRDVRPVFPAPGRYSALMRVVLFFLLILSVTRAVILFSAGERRSFLPLVATGDIAPFVLAATGCPMAHCDPHMSDFLKAGAPGIDAQLLWHDIPESPPGQPVGSELGLGCVSNGMMVACSFGRKVPGSPAQSCDESVDDTVIVYRYDERTHSPTRIWSSGDLLTCSAFTSAPMIGSDESIVAADSTHLIRFDASGHVLWSVETPGGIPISPVQTANGVIILGTYGGPISAYDSVEGTLLDQLTLPSSWGQYQTINTPAVSGNRVYIVMSDSVDISDGRLVAIDVAEPSAESVVSDDLLHLAWYLPVGAPNGASPLVVEDMIYFDGDRLEQGQAYNPHVFAVQDTGQEGVLKWRVPLPSSVKASFAKDPRGGLWLFASGSPLLQHYALHDINNDGIGDLLESINLVALMGEEEPGRPGSVMSIAGTETAPIMIVAANVRSGSMISEGHIAAIDLVNRALLWKQQLPNDYTAGQFPVMQGGGKPWVIFSTHSEGVWGISEP